MIREIHAYSPYLEARGGGESYFLAILGILAEDRPVTLHVPAGSERALDDLDRLYGLDRSRIGIRIHGSLSESSLATAIPPEAVFFQTSNSAPLLVPAACRVTYHQICLPRVVDPRDPWLLPGRTVEESNRETRERLRAHHRVIVTSAPLGERLTRVWGVETGRIAVVHPRIDPLFLAGPVPEYARRQPRILSVGRFDPMKHFDDQIRCFREIAPRLPAGSRLILVGPGETESLPGYRRLAEGAPVDIRIGLSREELAEEYRQAAILWSLTDLSEIRDGMKGVAESFGMTVAEAQASGAVPVVAAAVGLRQVVRAGVNGLHVSSLAELGTLTELLLRCPEVGTRLAEAAVRSARDYAPGIFAARVRQVFSE